MTRFVFALVAVAAFAAVGESAVRSRGVRGGCGCGTPSATPAMPVAYPGMPVAVPRPAPPAPCCGNPGSVPGTVVPSPAPAGAPGGHQHNHGLLTPAAGPGGVAPVSATVLAADKAEPAKEVKLTGTLVCGKCALKATPKCSNVLQVKEGDKVVNYFLDDKGNGEPYHEGVCGGDKVEGVTVAGTVTEKDGKKYVKPTKVETKK